MKTTILKLIILTIVFTSCNSDDIIGSGNLIEQSLSIPAFNKIKIISSANINISYSDTQSIVLIADDNLINDISTEVENSTLIIKYKHDNNDYKDESVTLNISLPDINHINVIGNSKFVIFDFSNLNSLSITNIGNTDLFLKDVNNLNDLTINNIGNLKFSSNGNVVDFSIKNSGNQTVNCFDLIAKNCVITSSGNGKTSVFCNDSLNITSSGNEKVFYKGFPIIDIRNIGSGSVTSAN